MSSSFDFAFFESEKLKFFKSLKVKVIMYKYILFTFLLLVSQEAIASVSIQGCVAGERGEPLEGVVIHWKNTSVSTITDKDGEFSIPRVSQSDSLVVAYLGYATQTIKVDQSFHHIHVVMKETAELQEVVVNPQNKGLLSMRTTVLQTQKITYDELVRAACCNLAESFETNPSVDVAYSDAVTGAKQIKLLGLSGTYVQMLTENFPNFRGLSAPYGLDYVPGPWMESILVSKGTSSVKNGYEAITGQINVEYKKPPVSDIVSANLFASDKGRYEMNADASVLLNKELSTGLFIHYSNEQKEFDMNDDGFLDSPLKHQFNVMNRWYYRNPKFISQAGVKLINESRTGGQKSDALPVTSSVPLYRTTLTVNRGEFFTKNGLILDPKKNESIALIFSGSYHDQESSFGTRPYDATQTNLYLNLMYEADLSNPMHRISTGLSLNYDRFDETYNLFYADPDVDYLYHPEAINEKRKETVGGAYVEYTFNKNDKLILLAGLRGDYSSLYDFFITPRLHVKYNFTDRIHLRASAGKGFRTAHVLPENSFYLAGSRSFNIANDLNQEEVWNYGMNLGFYIPIAGKELVLNGEWYYTDFRKQVVVDIDSDPHAVSFYNLDGKSYSSNFQVEATYPFFRGFTLTAAYRMTDAKTTYNGILRKKPLTSDYKGLITASYQTPLRKWQFDATSQFNGGGRMPDADKTNPLWKDSFDSFVILNAQISKFFRTWSVYAGAENILDFVQEHPVISPESPRSKSFDATMIWGPVHGRKFYIGMRWNLPRI
jgi:outer membrane receptor for ferrienterochelin and colicin